MIFIFNELFSKLFEKYEYHYKTSIYEIETVDNQ